MSPQQVHSDAWNPASLKRSDEVATNCVGVGWVQCMMVRQCFPRLACCKLDTNMCKFAAADMIAAALTGVSVFRSAGLKDRTGLRLLCCVCVHCKDRGLQTIDELSVMLSFGAAECQLHKPDLTAT
jgi:hypothetical protein